MSSPLDKLYRLLRGEAAHVDKPTLHGFLTALAVGPEEASDRVHLGAFPGVSHPNQISVDPERIARLVNEIIDQILDALEAEVFEAALDGTRNRGKAAIAWCRGFFHAVALAQDEWEAAHAEHSEAVKPYGFLLALMDAAVAETLLGVPPHAHQQFASDIAPTLGFTVQVYFNALQGLSWDGGEDCQPATPITLADLPSLDPDTLAKTTNDMLFEQMADLGDGVPKELIQELVHRGDLMAERLSRFSDEDDVWHWDDAEEQIWTRIHVVMTLGLMGSRTAARGLLGAFERMCASLENDENTPHWDWLEEYWAGLFRNARAHTVDRLRTLAHDPSKGWQARFRAIDCLLTALRPDEPAAFEAELDQLASWAADPDTELLARAHLCAVLLDCPRERHRALIEAVAELQLDGSLDFLVYEAGEIPEIYEQGIDAPAWDAPPDPWNFYAPEEILSRVNENLMDDPFLIADDVLDPPEVDGDREPRISDHPEIGPDDPCPCGSGKTYEICCMGKDRS